jgi:signal transduction histidine kinase
MAFVDMRMPPGWDGLETIENVRYIDPDLEIVICTAYSDHPWEEIHRRIGNTDKLLILMKPFNSIEVVQLAHSLMKKWNLARSVKQQIDILESSARQRTAEWREANDRLQGSIARRMKEIEKDLPQDGAAAVLSQKEEYLAIMSHEILTPMNELVGKVSLLLEGALNPGQRAHATTIQRCAQDLLALHNDMHEFMAGPRQEIRAGGRQ